MSEVFGDLRPYLVQVLNYKGTVEGTGFLCHRDGLVLTCWHVVEPWSKESTTKGMVRYAGKPIEADWLLERSDRAADLAVLKLYMPDDQEIPSLPLDVYEVHERTELTDPLESVGYPTGLFEKSGIPTNTHLQGKSPIQVNGLTVYVVTGDYPGNIKGGYSGVPVFNRRTQKVIGLVHGKQHDREAFMVPLTPLFEKWPELQAYHDVLELIRHRLGQLAQLRLDERLRDAPFIPPKLEVGMIANLEEGKTRSKPGADSYAYAHGRQWEAFSLKQLLPPRKSFVLSSDVGTGKSVFLDWLAVELVNKTRAVPIVMTCQALEKLNSPTVDDMIRTVVEQLRGEFSSHDIEAFIAESAQKGELVFLFDGLDQIGSGKPSALVPQVLSTVVRRPALITSRPSAVLSVENDTKLDFLCLQPFSAKDQQTYFGTDYFRAQAVCAAAPDLVRVPILAYMVRALITVEKNAEALTRTELYERFIKYILSTHESNRPMWFDNPDLAQNVQHELQRLAYSALAADTPSIQRVPMSVYPKDARVKIVELPTFGLLNRIVDQGEQALFFTHQSFQEFLAAKYAAQHSECTEKILNERWHPKWAEVIRFLAGLQGEVLVQWVLNEPDNVIRSNLFLAACCAGETKTLSVNMKGAILQRLMQLSETPQFTVDTVRAFGTMGRWLEREQIEWLIARLGNNNDAAHVDAVEVLRGLGARLDTITFSGILDWLDHDESFVRSAAARVLGGLGEHLDGGMLSALLDRLNDDNSDVRTAAVNVLGQLGEHLDTATLPALVARLHDDATSVRNAAVDALTKLCERLDAATLMAIVTGLRDSDRFVRSAAARVLGGVREHLDAVMLTALVDRLNDDDWLVRKAAVEALGRLGGRLDATMLAALVNRLHDDNYYVRTAVLGALRGQGGRLDTATRVAIVDRLHDCGNVAYEAAIRVLGGLGEHLDAVTLNAIVERLSYPNSTVRGNAVKALGHLGEHLDAVTLTALVDRLNDDDWLVRKAAVEALGQLGGRLDPTMLAALVDRLADYDWPVQKAAGRALGQLGDCLNIATLTTIVDQLHNYYRGTRKAVVVALGGLGGRLDAAMLVALVDRLRDEAWTVRESTVEALGQLREHLDALMFAALVDRLHDDNWHVRQSAVRTLRQLHDRLNTFLPEIDTTMIHKLEQLLDDKDEDVLSAAAEILGWLGDRLDALLVCKLANLMARTEVAHTVYEALQNLYRAGVTLPLYNGGKVKVGRRRASQKQSE